MPDTQPTLHRASEIEAALKRLAGEILAAREELPALVGIRTNGVPLAERLADEIAGIAGRRPEVGLLDITLYRDDLADLGVPSVKGSEIGFDPAGRRIVLVDDVLFTGRTVRAALNELADFGRPDRVELCVLVDRGLRELPIHADYVGFRVETRRGDKVRVELRETGAAEDRIVLRPAAG